MECLNFMFTTCNRSHVSITTQPAEEAGMYVHITTIHGKSMSVLTMFSEVMVW